MRPARLPAPAFLVTCVGDPGLEPGVREAAGLRPAGRPVVHVTLGVTGRSRTDTSGVTTRCSPIELQPPRAGRATYLRQELNPLPPASHAGALPLSYGGLMSCSLRHRD